MGLLKNKTKIVSLIFATLFILCVGMVNAVETTPTATVTNETAFVSWITNTSLTNVNATVKYGTTLALGSTAVNVSNVTNHVVKVTGLVGGTLYFYNTTYWNGTATIEDGRFNFTTTATPTGTYSCTGAEVALMALIMIVYLGGLAFFAYNAFANMSLGSLLTAILMVVFALTIGTGVLASVVHTACIV